MRKIFTFLVILFIFSLSCFGEEPTKIVEVKAFKAGAYDQIEVFTSSNINPKVLELDTHNQIALIFPNSKIEKPFKFKIKRKYFLVTEKTAIDSSYMKIGDWYVTAVSKEDYETA